jgi:hypothetical protein
MNYLDRTNLTFAALELNNDLKFGPVVGWCFVGCGCAAPPPPPTTTTTTTTATTTVPLRVGPRVSQHPHRLHCRATALLAFPPPQPGIRTMALHQVRAERPVASKTHISLWLRVHSSPMLWPSQAVPFHCATRQARFRWAMELPTCRLRFSLCG